MSETPEASSSDPTRLDVVDLGRLDYDSALRVQEDFVARRKAGACHDTILLVEHEAVYTLGRNARDSNILLDAAQLQLRDVKVVRTGRGGDVTYHGPGQLVGYPIVSLTARSRGVVWYVGKLEESIIATVGRFGIEATTDPINRGAWVGERKIAAIGVRVTRGITMHGFALNVTTDLANYEGIVPCGIQGRGVTSMHLLAKGVTMDAVKTVLLGEFRKAMGYA